MNNKVELCLNNIVYIKQLLTNAVVTLNSPKSRGDGRWKTGLPPGTTPVSVPTLYSRSMNGRTGTPVVSEHISS